MLILLEGVDGSGKTTLFKQLQDKGINTEKSIGRKEPFQYYKWLAISNKRGPFVVDRSFLTELVYRTVDDVPAMKMSLEEMLSVLKNCKIVLCDTESAYEDSMRRGEDNITNIQKSEKIKQTYRTLMSMLSKFTNVKIFTYDWKHQNVDDVIKFIGGTNNAV